MAKKTVNIGTSVNKGNGDPLRTAFGKINDNFDELYSALGNDGDLFDPSSVDQSLVPTTTNTVDLGSASKQWRSLYVSNNTIYIGGVAIGVDGNGNLTTGGTVVGNTPAWANITGKPTFATVATSGAYADLSGKPTSFSSLVNGSQTVNLSSSPVSGTTFSSGLTIHRLSGSMANITSDIDKVLQIATQTSNGRQEWSFGTDGILTLPQNGSIKSSTDIDITIDTPDSSTFNWQFGADGSLTLPSVGKISNGAYDWTFGSTGITTFPGVIKAGNINNLVVNDLGGGTSLTTGSQIQVGNSANDGAGVLIKNAVTNTLGGETSLESGSKIQMDNGNVSLFSYTYNGMGGGEGLEGRLGVEVDNSYLNNVVRIGLRVTNILEEGNTTAFSGWTFHGQSTSLTLPMGAVINETTSSPGLYRTKYSGNFVLDPTWFAANAGNIVNGDSFPEGILQNYDEVSGAFSFQYFGYFVPPTTANYTFRAHADETFIFWIGAKALSGYTYANKDMYGNYNGTFPEQQTQSFTIALTAGQFYPIRIQWANGGGFGELDVFTWANNVGQADTANFTGRVFMENTGTAKIAVNNNKSIILSTDNSTDNNWTFAPDGSLTLPIGVSINSSVSPLYPKIIADSGKLFSIQGQGSTGSAALSWTVNPDAASQYAAVSVSRAGGDNLAKVVLQAQSNSGDDATVKLWKFDETGALTIPGDIRSETGINIDVNLTDSTLRRWRFGEDGKLDLAGNLKFADGTNQSTAWLGIPGPYADDEAAALAGVALGSPYHKTGTGGQVFVRLTSPT